MKILLSFVGGGVSCAPTLVANVKYNDELWRLPTAINFSNTGILTFIRTVAEGKFGSGDNWNGYYEGWLEFKLYYRDKSKNLIPQ